MNLQEQKTRLSVLGIVLSVVPVLIILMILRIQVDQVEASRLEDYTRITFKYQTPGRSYAWANLRSIWKSFGRQ